MAGSNNCYLHFQYLPQYQVLYCSATSCEYCLTPGKGLHRHFNEEHDIKGSCKKELVEWIETLILIKPNELILPAAGSAPIPELPIYHGFTCTIGSSESCFELSVS